MYIPQIIQGIGLIKYTPNSGTIPMNFGTMFLTEDCIMSVTDHFDHDEDDVPFKAGYHPLMFKKIRSISTGFVYLCHNGKQPELVDLLKSNEIITDLGVDDSANYSISEEISLGNSVLLNEARAFWDFTTINNDENTVLSSHADSTGNGWNLNNSSGTLTPKLGKILVEETFVSSLKANTASGVKDAFITTAPCTNLLKGSHEIFMSLLITDGRIGAGWFLMGARDGGTRVHDLYVTSTGAIQIRYAAGTTGLTTLVTSSGLISDGFTGIKLIRVKMDFANDLITVYVDGVPYATTVSSGKLISGWNADNWLSSRACGIGGSWDGAFVADGSNQYKHILKLAITEILSDSEAMNVSLAMNNI